jgi:hypothetical protein
MLKNNEKCTLMEAIDLAIAEEWDRAHQIVQDLNSKEAAWIHAVLHRIEGDNSNAAYWYRQAGRKVSTLQPNEELDQIKRSLNS